MCPLSCDCPQNVVRTQCSLKRHMIDVSTVLRLSTGCGQDTRKLKDLENVCVWSDVFVWTVVSPCFCSASVLFCFCSVLFCFSFCSVSLQWMSQLLSCLPHPAPQTPASRTETAPSAVPPMYAFSLKNLSVLFRNIAALFYCSCNLTKPFHNDVMSATIKQRTCVSDADQTSY
jgi:hypothetical protein